MPNSKFTRACGGTGIFFEFFKVLCLDFFSFSEFIFIGVEVFTPIADRAI